MNDKEILILLGQIKANQDNLSQRMGQVETTSTEMKTFLANWRFGFSVLMVLASVGAFVFTAWSSITAAGSWLLTLRH